MNKTTASQSGRGRRGALMVVILLLLGSGLVRIWGDTGRAIAREIQPLVDSARSMPANEPKAAGAEGLDELLAMLRERDAALTAREEDLAKRTLELEARIAESDAANAKAKSQIAASLKELEAAEKQLADLLELADRAAEDDVAKLTSVYENMKPKVAAALFEEMAPAFAAGFLGRMRPDAAAAVMAGMSPEKAYGVSVILAGRHADLNSAASSE